MQYQIYWDAVIHRCFNAKHIGNSVKLRGYSHLYNTEVFLPRFPLWDQYIATVNDECDLTVWSNASAVPFPPFLPLVFHAAFQDRGARPGAVSADAGRETMGVVGAVPSAVSGGFRYGFRQVRRV